MLAEKRKFNCFFNFFIIFSGLISALIFLAIIIIAVQPDYFKQKVNHIANIPTKTYKQLVQVGEGNRTKNFDKNNPVGILMYHYVRDVDKNTDPVGFSLSVSPIVFNQQMKYLSENYNVISFSDFEAGKIPQRAIILTFDDGYADFYTNAAPTLKYYNFPSVAFIITEKLGDNSYLTAVKIRELAKKYKVEIGSHTASHPNLTNASVANQNKELKNSQRVLELVTGDKIDLFCYPSGHFNEDVKKVVRQNGYKIAVTTQERLAYFADDRLALPRVRITGSMGLDGLKNKLEDFFKNSKASGTSSGI